MCDTRYGMQVSGDPLKASVRLDICQVAICLIANGENSIRAGVPMFIDCILAIRLEDHFEKFWKVQTLNISLRDSRQQELVFVGFKNFAFSKMLYISVY